MTYYGAKEIAESFRTVRKNTLKIAEEIGEEHFEFRATPDTRSVRETLAHVAAFTNLPEAMHGAERVHSLIGFDFLTVFSNMIAEEKSPRTKAQILELLRERGERFAGWVEGLSEELLGERVTLLPGNVPPVKSRFEMLLGVKEHEMHHRGQLMLTQRLVGLVPHLTREREARLAAVARQ